MVAEHGITRQSSGIWKAVLLVGPTGSGKTPLGQILDGKALLGRRCFHFDFGANLREIDSFSGPVEGITREEKRTINGSLESGVLFEDKDLPLALKILRRFISVRGMTPRDILLLNGFPRHRAQAEGIAGIIAVEKVVLLDCPAEVILERIRSDTGGDRGERKDDSMEAVRKRLKIFEARTRPLLDYYEKRGIPVAKIEVGERMTPGEMVGLLER